jgi:hypothetical protein
MFVRLSQYSWTPLLTHLLNYPERSNAARCKRQYLLRCRQRSTLPCLSHCLFSLHGLKHNSSPQAWGIGVGASCKYGKLSIPDFLVPCMLRLSPRILPSAFNRNPTGLNRFLNVESSLWSAQGRSSPRPFPPLLRDSSSDRYRLSLAQDDGSHQSRFQFVFFSVLPQLAYVLSGFVYHHHRC